jgi:hypothetical protein
MAASKKQAVADVGQRDDRLESLSHPKNLTDLYEHDYYTWARAQAQALRERKVSGLDWDNLAEEVEDLGKVERHRLESHLESLLMHLLKWAYQPQRRSRSWSNSIGEHRFRVRRVLRDNPGLKARLSEVFADAYDAARFAARRETALDLSTFPGSCPWSLEDAMRDDFWPGYPPQEKPRRRAKRSGTTR